MASSSDLFNIQRAQNANADALSFEKFINDEATVANPGQPNGTLTTRLGRVYRNLSRFAADLTTLMGLPNGGPWFQSADTVVADTALTYTANLAGTVAAGDRIQTVDEGFTYEVLAEATLAFSATNLTGYHLSTAGGVRLRVVPIAGRFHAEAFGATLTDTLFNHAAGIAAELAHAQDNSAPRMTFVCSSNFDADVALRIARLNNSVAFGLNVDMQLSRIRAVAGGSLVAASTLLTIKCGQASLHVGGLELNRVCSGVNFNGCITSTMNVNGVYNWSSAAGDTGFGVKVDGSTDNSLLGKSFAIQWRITDAEFTNESMHTGRAYWLNGIDFMVKEIVGGWTKTPIYLGPVCSIVHLVNIHPYNGNPTMARTDPDLIRNESTGPVYLLNSYLDNGLIHDLSEQIHASGNHMLELAANVTLSDPQMRIYCSQGRNGQFPNQRCRNNTSLSIGFVPSANGLYNWGGDQTAINTAFDEQLLPSVESDVVQRNLIIGTRGDNVPLKQIKKNGGAIVTGYQSAANGVASAERFMVYDPNNDLVNINFPFVQLSGWGVYGAGAALTIIGGSLTPTAQFHVIDTEGAGALDNVTTIATTGIADGVQVTFCTVNTARDAVFENGTGNIVCGSNRTLSAPGDVITFVKVGTSWRMVSYENNV